MKIIGITGGVGSGKSRVLSYIEEKHQAVICQADHIAWKIQEPGQEGYRQIIEMFGENIINADKTINRKALGRIVFHDEKKLLALNAIMHPTVKEAIENAIREEQEKGTKLFVLEAALLIEEHYDEICDELWYIYTSESIRRSRLKESRQYSDEKINAIMANQLSEEVFRRECQRIIENSGDFETTTKQIDDAIKQLGER